MRELQTTEISIYQPIDRVWELIASIDRNGHMWLPHTAAVVKKTLGDVGEHALFRLSHFSSDSLCQIVRFVPMSELELEIATDYARVSIKIIFVADVNAVQLTVIVRGQLYGWRSWLGLPAYWYMKRVFEPMTERMRKMVVQPD